MLIIDGDYPMAVLAVRKQRDLTLPIEEVRAAEDHFPGHPESPDSETMASLPELRRGEVAAALVKIASYIRWPGYSYGDVRSDELAYAAGQGQLAYYRVLESQGEARLLKTRGEFSDHMRLWLDATDYKDLPVGMVIGMEGADPIAWPQQVHEWWENGLRVVSLSCYGISRYSHGTGTGTEGGLLDGAEELLGEMESLGMILDVTHTSDESIRQALDAFSGPVIASHQNCRALVPGERQFPDELLTRIIDRGAVIGHSIDAHMLWRPGIDWANVPDTLPFAKEDVTLDDFVDHVDHVCQLAGDSLHSAIGGDTDGQGGAGNAPKEIDTVADYQKVADVLDHRGYSESDIENVMYRNWQRYFETWLPL